MPEKPPVLDLPEALNRALDDVDFLKMMMEEFRQSLPGFVDRIDEALKINDMDTLDKTAHQLKGAAASLAAKQLAAASLELEKIGKSGNHEGARQALQCLKDSVAAFNMVLSDINWTVIGRQSEC